MQREHSVPIQQTEQSLWLEASGLDELRSIGADGLDLERQGRHARKLHLGSEFEQAPRLDARHTPKIQCLPVSDGLGVTPTAPQPRPPDESIHDPAQPPQPRSRVVTLAAADSTGGPMDVFRRRIHIDLAAIRENRAARPVRVTRDRTGI